jgi:hypothetical protein
MKNTKSIELGTNAALTGLKQIIEQPERNAETEKHALVAFFQQACLYLTAEYTDEQITEIAKETLKLHRKAFLNTFN